MSGVSNNRVTLKILTWFSECPEAPVPQEPSKPPVTLPPLPSTEVKCSVNRTTWTRRYLNSYGTWEKWNEQKQKALWKAPRTELFWSATARIGSKLQSAWGKLLLTDIISTNVNLAFSYKGEVKHMIIEQNKEGKVYLDEDYIFNSTVVSHWLVFENREVGSIFIEFEMKRIIGFSYRSSCNTIETTTWLKSSKRSTLASRTRICNAKWASRRSRPRMKLSPLRCTKRFTTTHHRRPTLTASFCPWKLAMLLCCWILWGKIVAGGKDKWTTRYQA